MSNAEINGKHLLRDWGLHVEDIEIEPSEVNDSFVDIPGGKTLDLTEANGPVTYKRRKIALELGGVKSKKGWRTFLSEFLNSYHGKKVKLIFDDDTGFYYEGRAYIEGDAEKTARVGKFGVEVDAEPYKYEAKSSQERWEWDSFNFHSGVIRYIGEVQVIGSLKVLIPTGNMLAVPVFYVADALNLRVRLGDKEYQLANGKNRHPQIKIGGSMEMALMFSGSGKVKIDYRGGSL